MWPHKNIDFYVHLEFELPERFYAKKEPLSMGAYLRISRGVKLDKLVTYIGGLTTFPNILARIFIEKEGTWMVIQLRDLEQLDDFCKQIY